MAKKKAADRRREMNQRREQNRVLNAEKNKADERAEERRQWDESVCIPAIQYEPAAQIRDIDAKAPIEVVIETFSPLHLGAGRADIHVDADVVQDDVGLPYFPAKRFKGLLYESGREVAEMAEASGLVLFERAALDCLFQRGYAGEVQLVVSNLRLSEYERIHDDLRYLEERYPSVFRPADILNHYAGLRWQTAIDRETGTAKTTSLHNMRVIEKGKTFRGELRLLDGTIAELSILALAARNLSQCGGKRTRGFGRIGCTLRQGGRDILAPLVERALKNSGQKGGKR